MCFEQLVNDDFDKDACAIHLAGTDDENIISSVNSKIDSYLNNLKKHIQNSQGSSQHEQAVAAAKGLPKKYHTFLQQVIDHLSS